MKIPLRNRKGEIIAYALVDDADYAAIPELSTYRWSYMSSGYVHARIQGRAILLHRLIMGVVDAGRSVQVDHISGDKLDNRRENLRITSWRGNQTNQHGRSNASPYGRNVYYVPQTNKSKPYKVQGRNSYGKRVYMGYFATVEEAQLVAREMREGLGYLNVSDYDDDE